MNHCNVCNLANCNCSETMLVREYLDLLTKQTEIENKINTLDKELIQQKNLLNSIITRKENVKSQLSIIN